MCSLNLQDTKIFRSQSITQPLYIYKKKNGMILLKITLFIKHTVISNATAKVKCKEGSQQFQHNLNIIF